MAISIIRTLIVYGTIVLSMRIMGKRQLGDLQPAELVVAVLISDLAAHPLQDIGIPLLYGLVPALILVCCEVMVSAGIMKSIRFRAFICGKPSLLISNGVIDQKEMKKNRFTIDELVEQLRKKDVVDIGSVKFAVLEADGTLSTILYSAEAPVTPKQLNLAPPDQERPVIIISDGRVLKNNLTLLGYNDTWLETQLKKRKARGPETVFLMTADQSGKVFFAQKEG